MKITDLKLRIVEVETVERSELHYQKHLAQDQTTLSVTMRCDSRLQPERVLANRI